MNKTYTATIIAIALSCLLLLLCMSMSIPAPVLAQEEELKPDLTIAGIKPYHYYDEEDETFKGEPWFNLENEVDVTVENIGGAEAVEFYVNLSARVKDEGEYELIDKLFVSSLDSGSSETLTFKWTPVGEDCFEDCSFTDTFKDYELKAVADCDNDVNESESGETNNEKTEVVTVCYNGYMADEPLKNIAQGTVHGGLIFTTGNGEYGGLYSAGASIDTTYEITLPEGALVVLARLNVYYTWHKDKESCPEMEVSIDGNTVSLDAIYNDIKCWESNNYLWGNYVYDLTDNIRGSGTYTVTVERTGASMFSIAAPGIILVYEDKTAPMREYWINEGADLLIGGRRNGEVGYLSLEECNNTATFPEPEEPVDLEIAKAALGVVSPWAEFELPEGRHNYVYFNGVEIGQDVYCGYHGSCSSDEEIEGISMSVESEVAEVGIAVFDVTDYLEGCDNEVIQGDDGDNMMPTNAFLVITYEEDEEAEEQNPPDIIPQEPVDTEINNIEGESRTFAISIDQSVDIVWQLNGTEVQTDEGVTEATYTNTSAVSGTWNVSVIGTSRETGLSDMHTWIWNVTAAVGTTPTSAVNITTTPSPTPTLTAIPASSVSVTPTPTPTPTTATPRPEEKKKAEAEETKAPGFELAISLVMLIAVAYLLRKRRKL